MSNDILDSNLPSISIDQLAPILHTLLGQPDFNRALFIWGPTGVGKSAAIRQTVRRLAGLDPFGIEDCPFEHGCERFGEWGLIDERVSNLDATDLRGCPFPENGLTHWLPPEELPLVGQEHRFPKKGLLFLDEVNLAEPAVQAGCYSLVLDQRCGTHKLLPGWKVVAAGNLRSEKAYTFELGQPLKNRFLHYRIVPSLDAFKKWAYKVGLHEDIIAFLNFRSDYLHKNDCDTSYGFPTPRSWEYVNEVLKYFTNGNRSINISACVGMGVAQEFLAFQEIRQSKVLDALNNVPALLAGEATMPLKGDDFQTAWAFSAGLMSHLREHPDCLPDMMRYLCSKDWKEIREISRLMLKDIRFWDEERTFQALLDNGLLASIQETYKDFSVG